MNANRHLVLAAVLAAFACRISSGGDQGGAAAGGSKALVVKITDRAGKVTYEAMSPEDWKALQKQIALETRLHPKALMEAEKAWREDETVKKKSFPKMAISPRKAQVVKEFNDAGKAADYAATKEAEESEKTLDAEKKQEERDKLFKRSKEEVDKEKQKNAEKESLYTSARNLYDTKLAELMSAESGEGAAQGQGQAPQQQQEKK